MEIYSYDRIGLVGDNGAGTTRLLKILSGNLTIADADVRRFGSIALRILSRLVLPAPLSPTKPMRS